MLISSLILIIAYVFIAVDKIPKVTIAMLGASITLLCGVVPKERVFSHIDFSVIFLLVGMMIIVHIAGRSGMFKWAAIEIIKFTKGNPKLIFLALTALTAVLSAFLDNVTTVVLIMPVTFVMAKALKIDPFPFLISEIFASNIGGTATLIGDPPNIIIGSAAGFSFLDFLKELFPIILIIFIVSVSVLMFIFRKKLVAPREAMDNIVNYDNSSTIKNYPLMIRSLVVLSLVILGFVLHDKLHIEAYVFAVFGASLLLIFEKPKDIIYDVEWNTIFFFIGLFIIIGGFIETGGIKFLAAHLLEFTKGNLQATSMIVLWGSGVLSAFVDNIPYTVTMTPLIQELHSHMNIIPLWWSLSLGACLGGNATIIGAAANVIVAESSSASGHPIGFMRFLKYGILITFISLALSSIYLYLRFLI